MSAEVTRLNVVADTDKTRSESVARMLTRLLEQAQKGEITDVCYIAVRNGAYEIGRTTSIMDAISQSSFLNYRFCKQMER